MPNDARDLPASAAAFVVELADRLADLGIDVRSFPVGHVAVRTKSLDEYLVVRAQIEPHCVANVENLWSGRPISKLLLRSPAVAGKHHVVPLIELIPPPHGPGYRLGLEHVGFVVGDRFASFLDRYDGLFTGRQDQGRYNQPAVISFGDGTLAKFHEHSLHDVVVMEGRTFDGFRHVTLNENSDPAP